jgi:hypothetical protein
MFSKPNVKSVTNAGVTALAIVAGAKIGDGIVAVMPDSISSYKKILVGGVALIAAASVSAKTPVAQGVQNALIGVGVKQLCDEVTENLKTAIAVKDTSTVTNKFINAVVGYPEVAAITAPVGVGAAWDNTQVWDRPTLDAIPASFDAASMM